MKMLRENPVQLLFLDIQMPELSGVEFAKILPRETKRHLHHGLPPVCHRSAKVSALDYLLKPISYEDFLKSTDKALDWFVTTLKQDTCQRDRFMFVKSDYKLQRVCLDDILYIEASERLCALLPEEWRARDVAHVDEEARRVSAQARIPAHPPFLYRSYDRGSDDRSLPHRFRRCLYPHIR